MRRNVKASAYMIAMFLFLGWLVGTSESFQKCEHERKNHEPYKALHEKSSLFVKAVARLELHASCTRLTASENDGAIAALSGVAVAIFTFTLWLTTNRLWIAARVQAEDMKESLRIAQESADAAKTAAVAANSQTFLTEQSLTSNNAATVAINRPYLTASEFSCSPVKDIANGNVVAWAIVPAIRNVGNTPARKVKGIISFFPSPLGTLPVDYNYQVKFSDSFWPDIGTSEVRWCDRANFSLAAWKDLVLGKFTLFIYGAVEYESVFERGKKLRTEFCVRLNAAGDITDKFDATFSPYGRHNATDGDSYVQPSP